jgi:hypothetical protein
LGLILGALSPLAGEPSPAANRQRVRIDTVDEVNLHGCFYPGKGKAACAVILHDLAEDNALIDREEVAQELQRLGLAVLTFDFRGHGDSVGVDPGFWNVPVNRQLVRGYRAGKPPYQVSHQDFKSGYHPALANDVAGAKLFLDRKNDDGECNSARVILIGAGEGATVGALWLASESCRFRATTTSPLRLSDTPEGHQVAAGVWLNMTPTLGRRKVPATEWLRQTGRKGRIPMAFLHGEEDTAGAAFARRCLEVVDPRGVDRQFTATQAVPGTVRTGTDKTGPAHPATPLICNYVKSLLKDTPELQWQLRDVKEQTFYWVFPGSKPELAKKKGEPALRVLPQHALGLP